MRILVVEDKDMHRQSAKETLLGHEVTIVGSFDEAMDLMKETIDNEKVVLFMAEAGLPPKPDSNWEQERWSAYWRSHSAAEKKSVIPFPFEVVLTDMMMPMSRRTLAPGIFEYGEEVPYGFVIALRAALFGVKYIAMLTDTNHHKGAMSASLDNLGSASYHSSAPNFEINGAKAMFVHSPFVADIVGKEECYSCRGNPGVCRFCQGKGVDEEGEPCEHCCLNVGKCDSCGGTGQKDKVEYERKDWGQVLKDLISPPSKGHAVGAIL